MRLFYGESGTIMLFQQTAAPTGWTKITTHNDKALRVVSGAASSGGATAFSTIFNSGTTFTTNGHTLSAAQSGLVNHTHSVSFDQAAGGSGGIGNSAFGDNLNSATSGASGASAASSAHSHTLTMDLLFVDLILASKT